MEYIVEKYQIIKNLGKGAFGKVYLAKYNNTQYAVKQVLKSKLQKQPNLISYFQDQIECLRSIDSTYVMKLITVQQDQYSKFLVCEYCNGGNLFQYQFRLPGLVIPLQKTLYIVSHILKGLQQLHNKSYLHRDLKPQNILVQKQGDNQIFKIADFGFARKQQNSNGTFLGTNKFIAPQLYKDQKYGFQIDIWSLGVIIYFMLNSQYPFNPQRGRELDQIKSKCVPFFSYKENVLKTNKKIMENCTPETEDLFKRLFEISPEKRIDFHQIKTHPLFIKFFSDKNEILQTSSILYKQKNILIQSKLFNSKKQQILTEINEVNDEQSNIQLSTKDILYQIQFYFNELNFIFEICEDFQSQNQYLSNQMRVALLNNLLKYYIITAKNLNQLLKSKKLPADCSKNINRQNLFKNAQYQRMFDSLNRTLLIAQSKFKNTYNECIKYHNQIKKIFPNFINTLKPQIIQKCFNDFKAIYRQVTKVINTILIQKSKKYEKNDKLELLRSKILLCHVLNNLFLKKEIQDNFVYFLQWKKKQKQLKQFKQKPNFDFISFKRWLNQQKQISFIIKTVNKIWKKYFG